MPIVADKPKIAFYRIRRTQQPVSPPHSRIQRPSLYHNVRPPTKKSPQTTKHQTHQLPRSKTKETKVSSAEKLEQPKAQETTNLSLQYYNLDNLTTMALTHKNLPFPPPTTKNLISNFPRETIDSDAAATRIVIHPRFPSLLTAFLSHKRTHGSAFEKALYTPSFTWRHLASRLLEKRPLTFMNSNDFTILRDGTEISSATGEWDRVGTATQDRNEYLKLQDYLSYDEIMLGSLVGVSGPSHFINDGSRMNRCIPGKPGTFQRRGVIVGVVGARFEREGRMDSVFILPKSAETTMHPELIGLFEEFFGVPRSGAKFNEDMYSARMRVTVDILLHEANARAKDEDVTAWLYIVGLGLGVWQYDEEQAGLFIDSFTAALTSLPLSALEHVTTLEFAYINVPAAEQKRVTAAAARHRIEVHFSKRNPAEKLETDELLVLSYAWDGNSMPGNEYWAGSLAGSGDPAAACMSTIGELHNPLVNPGLLERIRICGNEDEDEDEDEDEE